MSQSRESMINALNEFVIPKLREQGFSGKFPHFRRISQGKIDLLTFQFDRHGGGFIIEIAKCPSEGITTYFGDHIPPNKVRAWDMGERFRIQPKEGSSTSDWFRYDDPSRQEGFIERPVKKMLSFLSTRSKDSDCNRQDDVYVKTAKQVLPFLMKAEKWWIG
jgi:hypothetical protein